MSEVYPVPAGWKEHAIVDEATYRAMYARSVADPDAFWLEQAERLDWIKRPEIAGDWSFDERDFRINWFADGRLNVAANCIDRHLASRGGDIAIIWEPDDPAGEPRRFTYLQLHREVCRFANVLKAQGVRKGDRVTIYMPMIPEAAFAVLACARIGAIHSVVFGGFSPEALAGRIADCDSCVVVTADEGRRGGKRIALKANVDEAAKRTPALEKVIVVKATGGEVAMTEGRDIWYHEAAANLSADCAAETMSAEDPLFILYTSGSTGKPKGVLHTSGGYLLWASLTHELCFDYRPGDIWWCAADIGWVTGHTYILYGPLANGATTLMYEGVPHWPDASRLWQIVDRHNVHTIFTAPTALRALMKDGDEFVAKTSRKSLKLLGAVGEPINPEAWRWYYEVVGEARCPIIDTWWQTETGGAMIAPIPGATDLKPGSATRPMPGVDPQLVDCEGSILHGAAEGNLVIARSWPGQMRTVWGDHERFFQTYFSTYPGKYFTGDGCRRDADGYHWITGRVDDVINVSGHRMGAAEIESALVLHPKVAEAAVVGMPHDVKGQGIYAYVTLNAGCTGDETLRAENLDACRPVRGGRSGCQPSRVTPGNLLADFSLQMAAWDKWDKAMHTPIAFFRTVARCVAACLFALPLITQTAHAVEYSTRTKGNTKVRVYEQRLMPETSGSTTGGPGHVIAKYSDLIQKAIGYKTAHPSETVEIRFTMYRMSFDIYMGFNPASSSTYLDVSDSDFAGADSEKLVWSFCKAAQAGVIVKLIIHKDGETTIPLSTITDYLDANGGSNLSYKIVGWGGASNDQMHNKFLLVNKTRSGSTDYHSIVYTTSANIDEWQAYGPISSKNWQQTGVLLYQNSGVYNAYEKYFDDALWPHAEDTSAAAFRSTMASLHSAPGGLNYAEDADGVSAYFYPVSAGNLWSPTYNPVAKVFDIINNASGVTAPFVKMNQAFLRFHHASWTEFGEIFMDEINTMAFRHSIDLSDPDVANVRCVAMDHDDDGNDFSPIASNRLSLDQPTHSKNFTFALTLNGTPHYYSIGGSTNAKYNDFVYKANNMIMIHEVGSADKEVYQDFYDVFDYIFNY